MDAPHIGYDSGESLMASGSTEHLATRIEAAIGRPMPQVEVRYRA